MTQIKDRKHHPVVRASVLVLFTGVVIAFICGAALAFQGGVPILMESVNSLDPAQLTHQQALEYGVIVMVVAFVLAVNLGYLVYAIYGVGVTEE